MRKKRHDGERWERLMVLVRLLLVLAAAGSRGASAAPLLLEQTESAHRELAAIVASVEGAPRNPREHLAACQRLCLGDCLDGELVAGRHLERAFTSLAELGRVLAARRLHRQLVRRHAAEAANHLDLAALAALGLREGKSR